MEFVDWDLPSSANADTTSTGLAELTDSEYEPPERSLSPHQIKILRIFPWNQYPAAREWAHMPDEVRRALPVASPIAIKSVIAINSIPSSANVIVVLRLWVPLDLEEVNGKGANSQQHKKTIPQGPSDVQTAKYDKTTSPQMGEASGPTCSDEVPAASQKPVNSALVSFQRFLHYDLAVHAKLFGAGPYVPEADDITRTRQADILMVKIGNDDWVRMRGFLEDYSSWEGLGLAQQRNAALKVCCAARDVFNAKKNTASNRAMENLKEILVNNLYLPYPQY